MCLKAVTLQTSPVGIGRWAQNVKWRECGIVGWRFVFSSSDPCLGFYGAELAWEAEGVSLLIILHPEAQQNPVTVAFPEVSSPLFSSIKIFFFLFLFLFKNFGSSHHGSVVNESY